MKRKKRIVSVGLIILGLIALSLSVSYYFYYGGNYAIEVKEEQQGGEILVYENLTGDYSQAASVSNKLYYKLLCNDSVNSSRAFAIYYDDPTKVKKGELRSIVGCVIDDIDSLKLADLKSKYNVKVFPKAKYMTAQFPMEGYPSILVALNKVYPALNRYAANNEYGNGSVMEMYDMKSKMIYYRKEIVKK